MFSKISFGGVLRRRFTLGLASFVVGASVLAVAPTPALAAGTISLASQSGGTYDYELVTDNSGITFNPNSTVIVLSGLSGVTGASVSGALAGPGGNGSCGLHVSSFTATSVTVSNTGFGDPCAFNGNTITGTLEVDSTVTTAGTVNWTIENSEFNGSGVTQGPVAGALSELQALLAYVNGLPPGTSLSDKVQAALSDFQAADTADTCSELTQIINEAKAQSGKHLTAAQASTVIADAQQIQATIGCGT
jgi:hypothetical protein